MLSSRMDRGRGHRRRFTLNDLLVVTRSAVITRANVSTPTIGKDAVTMRFRTVSLFAAKGVLLLGASMASGDDPIALLEADPSMRTTAAGSEEIGDGFRYHGPAVPVAQSRGMVSTQNAEGDSVVLVWLGSEAILEINVDTDAYREHPNPHFSSALYASILSSDDVYYTASEGQFVRFDPKTDAGVELIAQTTSRRAFSMIEDDEGVIWAAMGDDAGLIRYDPRSGEFDELGSLYEAERRNLPRNLAADDRGWLYMSVSGPRQILMIEAETGEVTPAVPEDRGEEVGGGLWRATDGKVYSPQPDDAWIELHGGQVTWHNQRPDFEREYRTSGNRTQDLGNARFATGSQGLMHRQLPNGERVKELDLANRRLTVENPATGETRLITFDYEKGFSSAIAQPIEATSVGTIAGATAYPRRFFSYHPSSDQWTRGEYAYGSISTSTTTRDGMYYIGSYTEGVMLEWNPREPWVATEPGNPDSNPLYLQDTRAHPHIHRPMGMISSPDDRRVILAGVSAPSQLGGGLAIWDRQTRTAEILTHDDLIRYHNAFSIAALPEHRLLVGTSTGMRGGEERATGNARLYVLNLETKQIEWQKAAPDYQDGAYRGMTAGPVGPEGLVFIITSRRPPHRLLAFDPAERAVVHEQEVPEAFGMAASRSPRFIEIDDGRIFIFFHNVIAELDPATYELTERAALPAGGLVYPGAYLDGRLYFAAERSHIYSWEVPSAE